MATPNGWAEAPIDRTQVLLFHPSLDDMIPIDHEVRILDETLRMLDWSDWEAEFDRLRGQPPIHPRILAGIWIYELARKMKTSRPPEYVCIHNVDFMWLAEGRQPDHTTLAKFFTRFKTQVKSLFKQVVKVAMTIGLVRLGEVAFDGTRVKAHNSRFNTLTADSIEKRLAEVEQDIDRLVQEAADAQARADNTDTPIGRKTTQLPEELATLEARKAKLQAALETANQRDEERKKDGLKSPAQVPMNDQESRVMPNKEGVGQATSARTRSIG